MVFSAQIRCFSEVDNRLQFATPHRWSTLRGFQEWSRTRIRVRSQVCFVAPCKLPHSLGGHPRLQGRKLWLGIPSCVYALLAYFPWFFHKLRISLLFVQSCIGHIIWRLNKKLTSYGPFEHSEKRQTPRIMPPKGMTPGVWWCVLQEVVFAQSLCFNYGPRLCGAASATPNADQRLRGCIVMSCILQQHDAATFHVWMSYALIIPEVHR